MGNKNKIVKDSKNVVQGDAPSSIIGDITDSNVTIHPPTKNDGIDIGVDNSFLGLGGRIYMYLGVKRFFSFIIVSLISSGYISTRIFLDMYTGEFLSHDIQYVELIITVLGIVWFVFTFNILRLYFTRFCKKCNNRFALREIKKSHLGKAKVGGVIYHNIKSVMKCDICGEVYRKKVVKKESLQVQDRY